METDIKVRDRQLWRLDPCGSSRGSWVLSRGLRAHVRYQTVPVPLSSAAGGQPQHDLGQTRVRCQQGGGSRSFAACATCRRFIDARWSCDSDRATIRCTWRDTDPVSDLMVLPPAWVRLRPEIPVADACRKPRIGDVAHQPVVDDANHLEGFIASRDLFAPGAPGETVGDRMRTATFSVPSKTTLVQADELMRRFQLGFLCIVDGAVIKGLLNRECLGMLHRRR